MTKHFNKMPVPRFCWCLHCERVFSSQIAFNNHLNNTFYNCDASYFDMWDWNDLREANPSYPVIPHIGVKYPLYPSPMFLFDLKQGLI